MSTPLENYDPKTREKHWQKQWEARQVYAFRDDQPREQTFVIDTPPPTVSGVLHMGHIFSYTQADFIARYQRMSGKDVFYPMGFDDNGLPTERLVEKIKKIRAHNYISEHGREAFVALCRDVVVEAEEEFRNLFKSTALSVDWKQEYQTISDRVTALSQASFLDLIEKNQAYRDFRPTYWDWVDQTAIASAEIEEQEKEGIQCTIPFGLMDKNEWAKLASNPELPRPDFASLEQVPVMTTRPELLGACVALMCHPDDEKKYSGNVAVTPLFNVVVPICFDEKVDKEKGSGYVMCCSWGDDTDKEWIAKHELAWRPLVGLDGRIILSFNATGNAINFYAGREGQNGDPSTITVSNCLESAKAATIFEKFIGTKLIRDIKNENSAKGRALKLLEEAGLLLGSHPHPLPEGEGVLKPSPSGRGLGEGLIIRKTQMVKCAERSGTPIEIIPTYQWFVKVTDKKEALLAKGAECNWHPEFMRIRLNQWIEGLKEDWCISRQRFFGVPFPVWYAKKIQGNDWRIITSPAKLPTDPLTDLPKGFVPFGTKEVKRIDGSPELIREIDAGKIRLCYVTEDIFDADGELAFTADPNAETIIVVEGDKDVMDTWATSSISPQINAGAIDPHPTLSQRERVNKLFPADLRPQAHEIIRTWAFYTIVKAHLHSDSIPWKHLMISGWCLAADKTKMSKSKGNVVTPVALIEEKGADAVRYWASTSRLGTDTAFSEDLLKIGKKLVNKLFNASKFVSVHLARLESPPKTAAEAIRQGLITETLDHGIISRLHHTVAKATADFEQFEYADARVAMEDFFWNDFCDNYLELVKVRAYGEQESTTRYPLSATRSAHHTLYYCLHTILRLFAPIVPHITEELFSVLFTGDYSASGSIHARGMWPDAGDYTANAEAEAAFVECIELLEVVRKTKSMANVSIKYPLSGMDIYFKDTGAALAKLSPEAAASAYADLQEAGAIQSLEFTDKPSEHALTTESGKFQVAAFLAA